MHKKERKIFIFFQFKCHAMLHDFSNKKEVCSFLLFFFVWLNFSNGKKNFVREYFSFCVDGFLKCEFKVFSKNYYDIIKTYMFRLMRLYAIWTVFFVFWVYTCFSNSFLIACYITWMHDRFVCVFFGIVEFFKL